VVLGDHRGGGGDVARIGGGDGDHPGDQVRRPLDQFPGDRAAHRVADDNDRLGDHALEQGDVAAPEVVVGESGRFAATRASATRPVGDPAALAGGGEQVRPAGPAVG